MGLDWCLVSKAKEGYEEEVRSLREALGALNDGSRFTERLRGLINRRLEKVTMLPCEAVGAPKVKDREGWQGRLKERLEDYKRNGGSHWQKVSLDKFLSENAEKFDCDACPAKSEILGIFCRPCEFRGKIIGHMDFLGSLADEAYEDKSPEEMLDYARRLEEKRKEAIAGGKLAPNSEDDGYLLAAIRWLRRWSELGFSLYAWS
ncbi:MAG: hypothetical protein QMC90_01935 [Dehalococcoidales bacterium]|nr:hypothetical protein [Dehalococcoidales bacterium]